MTASTASTTTDSSDSSANSAVGIRWDLSAYYADAEDPRIVLDQQSALGQATEFASKYRGRLGGLQPDQLREAIGELENVIALAQQPVIYSNLLFAADTSLARNGALMQAAQQAWNEVNQQLLFFLLEWAELPESQAQALLEAPELEHYRHMMSEARKQKPFLLSEPEEKILSLKKTTGQSAFERLYEEVVSAITCGIGAGSERREVSLQEALSMLYRPERAQRAAAAEGITAALRERSRVLTFIFNNLVQEHADDDRLRGRAHPMQSRNLENEIDQQSVDALLDACDRHMPLVARYYELKRRLLKLDRLCDYDRYAPIGENLPACTYEDARQIVLEAYGEFSPRMAEVAEAFFAGNWIDAELRPGKRGGAFSAGGLPEKHPCILLNYTDTLRDVMTMAHELGHGIHQYLSRPQGLFQFNTPLTTAETASVFGEMLTFHKLMAGQQHPRVRLELLCSKLEDIFATVFRQAAMTRFEQKLHTERREKGELDAEAIGVLWMEANRAMFGDSVELREDYACWWSYISHFIGTPFYCYAYSFGELLVLALYNRYQQEGAAFVPKYLALLESGGSASPPELLSRLGLDISDSGFWEGGLKLLEDMVAQAEDLAAEIETAEVETEPETEGGTEPGADSGADSGAVSGAAAGAATGVNSDK